MFAKFLLAILVCVNFSTIAVAQDTSDSEKAWNAEKRHDFILDGAAKDISANISLWVDLQRESDAAFATGWAVALGDKIPSQPIAVIEVLSFMEEHIIDRVCPRQFFEGSEHYEMEGWMKRAITSLDSFTMKDSKKENIRIQCLEKVKTSLANKDKWS